MLAPFHKRPARRAFTVIAAAPNHLIGERLQVVKWLEKVHTPALATRASHRDVVLPPWFEEFTDLLPHWHVEILESPAEAAAFFRRAERNPDTPHCGLITFSKLSLSCGYALGVEDRLDSTLAFRLDRRLPDGTADAEQARVVTLRKAARTGRQAEGEAAAADTDERDEDDETRSKLPKGVSERTKRRDEQFKGGRMSRSGLCCPRCGHVVRDDKFAPISREKLFRRGLGARCIHCDEYLAQIARGNDNVQDRENAVFQSPDWQAFAYDHDGTRAIPWGRRPESNPRMALGLFIGKRYKGRVDLFLCDEVHEAKAGNTAIGRAFGAMVAASRKTVGMTGTLFGGKSSDVYHLLLRLGNRPVIQRWGWGNQAQFQRDCGVVEEITRERTSIDDAGHYSGKRSITTDEQERPGVTATLAMILQNIGVSVLLKNMGFKLVNYVEDLVVLDMPDEVAEHYSWFQGKGKEILRMKKGRDALSSYLQSLLTYPYAPWFGKTIFSRRENAGVTGPLLPADTVLPHHEWLAEYAAEQIKAGRRVLVYCEHTRKDDIQKDIADKITAIVAERHGVTLQCAVMRNVKAGDRKGWFAAREAEGVNVVFCHPKLVRTGLNLIGWPSIVVMEPVYSLFVLAQAKRRAFRPTQTKDCEVIYLCYRDTMSEQAISIVARKAAAAAIMSGDDLNGGLMEFDAGMSLLQELAASVLKGADEADALHRDVRAMLQQSAQTLKADMESGAAGLIGAAVPMEQAELAQPATVTLQPEDVIVVPTTAQPQVSPVTQPAVHPAPTAQPTPATLTFGDLSVVKGKVKATRKTLVKREAISLPDEPSQDQLDLFGALLEGAQQGNGQGQLSLL